MGDDDWCDRWVLMDRHTDRHTDTHTDTYRHKQRA